MIILNDFSLSKVVFINKISKLANNNDNGQDKGNAKVPREDCTLTEHVLEKILQVKSDV